MSCFELRIAHRGPEPMADVPSRMQRGSFAEEHAPNLARRNAFLALQHRVEDLKPSKQGDFRVLENCSRRQRETIGVPASTLRIGALPFPRQGNVVDRLGLATTRASGTVRPAPHDQKLPASVLVGKPFHQLVERHHA